MIERLRYGIRVLKSRLTRRVFTRIYERKRWRAAEPTVSGAGSTVESTSDVRKNLPELLSRLGIRILLDLPCGDFHWMSKIDLVGIRYIGADIVAPLIEDNRRRYPRREFIVADISRTKLPLADLLLSRDCLVHLSFRDALRAIDNIRGSGATYLLTTTFPDVRVNEDILTGEWRPLNLQHAPFNFPRPVEVLSDRYAGDGGRWTDKSLGLWRISDLT